MSETTVKMLMEMGFRESNPSLEYEVVKEHRMVYMSDSSMFWPTREPIVIPYPEMQTEDGVEIEKIIDESFQREIDDRLEQIKNINLCKVVASVMPSIKQPFREIEKESRWYPGEVSTSKHTYFNVFCGWNRELRIHVRFTDFDSDDQKDAVVESVLAAFHKKYKCLWTRSMSKNDSKFSTKVRIGDAVVDVVMQMDDSLGCWIEEVVSKREANKYEIENVVIKDGMVMRPCNDLEVGANGRLVKITKSFKSYCDGEAR